MAQMDEQILNLRNKKRQEEQNNRSIYDGIYDREVFYEFEEAELFSGQAVIALPTSFVDLPEELARIKYPMESRPQIIKSNKGCSVNLTFSYLPVILQDSEALEEAKEQMKMALQNYQPANVWYESQQETAAGCLVSWFDYKSHAIDCKIYNLMFLFPVAEGVITGTVNCPFSERNLWKSVGLQMIKSIRIPETEQETEGDKWSEEKKS